MHDIVRWFGYWTGIANEGGKGYGFWSGIGSCLTYLAVIGAAWRHLNCHSARCWRLAKHPVDGTPYKVCRKHHPTVPDRARHITVEHIHAAHRVAHEQ